MKKSQKIWRLIIEIATTIQKKRKETHTEKIFEEKNTDNLFKLMKDVRLPLKDTKEQSRRNKWKKNFLIWIYYIDFLRLLKKRRGT